MAYRPSEIAASSVIISINIYRRDQEKYKEENGLLEVCEEELSFFKKSDRLNSENEPQILLNTDFWDEEMVNLTGYTVQQLYTLILKLSNFIR